MQLVQRTDVAVAVRVESQALEHTGGVCSNSAPLAVVQATVLVAYVVARCICQLALMVLGGALCAAGVLAALLAPALRAAGSAALEASKRGCD